MFLLAGTEKFKFSKKLSKSQVGQAELVLFSCRNKPLAQTTTMGTIKPEELHNHERRLYLHLKLYKSRGTHKSETNRETHWVYGMLETSR